MGIVLLRNLVLNFLEVKNNIKYLGFLGVVRVLA